MSMSTEIVIYAGIKMGTYIFQRASMRMSIIVSYPYSIHCHLYIRAHVNDKSLDFFFGQTKKM
jgi:hypothetical protein